MKLYLVQHGKALPKDEDPDRHLSGEGRAETEKISGFVKPLGLVMTSIWHSGKTRALETAEILQSAVNSRGGLEEKEGLKPKDAVNPFVRQFNSMTEGDLMLVGHMPFLQKLADKLITGDEGAHTVDFRNSGVVCLNRCDGDWSVTWIMLPDLLCD